MKMMRALLGLGIWSAAAMAAGPKFPLELFQWEKVQLTESSASRSLGANVKPLDGAPASVLAGKKCRVFPGDSDWPITAVWQELNTTLSGALIKAVPAASVCYKQTAFNNYDEAKCTNLSSAWFGELNRMAHPVEVIIPQFQGLTCLPPSDRDTKGCSQGGYPVYVVNVSTVAHIQAAVNFARNTGIRLVIKNTGHDYSGKSSGAGALSVWTHNLKDIQFYENYTAAGGYTGPAFKVGTGVQASEILRAAAAKGHIVATGTCDSVGIYGGYSQGGGHSVLSVGNGMGADQVLSVGIVTADGQFRNASVDENADLFWAIRGGGGGTFGIVTSMVVKAIPDEKTAIGTFEFGGPGSNITADVFWKGLTSYFGSYKSLIDQGLFASWNIFAPGRLGPEMPGAQPIPKGTAPRMEIKPILARGKTLAQLQAAIKPWLNDMAALGINITTTWGEYATYLPAYKSNLPPTEGTIMPHTMSYSSRLIPVENFDKARKLDATVAAFRTLAEAGHPLNGFMFAPTLESGRPVGGSNAVLPAWRKAYSHVNVFLDWLPNATAAEQLSIRQKFAREEMKALRDATPDSGSYMNESDRLEPDWQQSFFGANYPRLLEIKNKYDPTGLFWAVTAVGSEGWSVKTADGLPHENGPLCRV